MAQKVNSSQIEGKDLGKQLPRSRMQIQGFPPSVWIVANHASDWLQDAIREAESEQSRHGRRREILFAVCFAESYLLEWVRDLVLERDFEQLSRYFGSGERRGIREKWKEIPKQLKAENLLRDIPNLSEPFWSEWKTLIEFRDGLVHARASLPAGSEVLPNDGPVPDGVTLAELPPGWTVGVVVILVWKFHEKGGIAIPEWLTDLGTDYVV